MRLRPKYTRAKEEGRRIQRSGSLISTFFMRCRSRRLVLAASGDDLFHQFHVLNTLLGSNRGFLHQPFALDAEHGILIHKFLDDEVHPLQQGSSLLCLLLPSSDLRPAASSSRRSDPSGYGLSHACACKSPRLPARNFPRVARRDLPAALAVRRDISVASVAWPDQSAT